MTIFSLLVFCLTSFILSLSRTHFYCWSVECSFLPLATSGTRHSSHKHTHTHTHTHILAHKHKMRKRVDESGTTLAMHLGMLGKVWAKERTKWSKKSRGWKGENSLSSFVLSFFLSHFFCLKLHQIWSEIWSERWCNENSLVSVFRWSFLFLSCRLLFYSLSGEWPLTTSTRFSFEF